MNFPFEYARTLSHFSPDRYSAAPGVRRMFLCRVAVGEYHLGRNGQIAPDERDTKKGILYDSTTDNMDDAQRDMFVTYHDAQACKYIAVCSFFLVALLTTLCPFQTPNTCWSILSVTPRPSFDNVNRQGKSAPPPMHCRRRWAAKQRPGATHARVTRLPLSCHAPACHCPCTTFPMCSPSPSKCGGS